MVLNFHNTIREIYCFALLFRKVSSFLYQYEGICLEKNVVHKCLQTNISSLSYPAMFFFTKVAALTLPHVINFYLIRLNELIQVTSSSGFTTCVLPGIII